MTPAINCADAPLLLCVVGCPKCGTTTLHRYFAEHPDIWVPTAKELHYFSYPELSKNSNGPADKAVVRECVGNWDEYLARLNGGRHTPVLADISPSYAYYPSATERIANCSAFAAKKAILMVREPISKIRSQYQHLRKEGRETLSLLDALEAEDERILAGYLDLWRYIDSTRYASILESVELALGAGNVLVVVLEDLIESPTEQLSRIARFAGVSDFPPLESRVRANLSYIPRSHLLSVIAERPSTLRNLAKAVLPSQSRQWLKLLIQRLNTGAVMEVDRRSRNRIIQQLSPEVAAIRRRLNRPSLWSDAGWG